jgi:hypothetical protein
MQFLSALVEHLVVGIFALIWGLPLATALGLKPDVALLNHKEILIAVGIPVAYVVGVYIDVFFATPLHALRRRLEDKFPKLKEVLRKTYSGSSSPFERTAKIFVKSPDEMARYLLQLSGRAKIARGVGGNALIAAGINLFVSKNLFTVSPLWLAIFALISFVFWLRLAALADKFKDNCCTALGV